MTFLSDLFSWFFENAFELCDVNNICTAGWLDRTWEHVWVSGINLDSPGKERRESGGFGGALGRNVRSNDSQFAQPSPALFPFSAQHLSHRFQARFGPVNNPIDTNTQLANTGDHLVG